MYASLPDYSEAGASSVTLTSEVAMTDPTFQPVGSRAAGNDTGSFFDIAPRSDSTSFQVGYLGLEGFQAWLKGDVLVKLDSSTKRKGRYTRCVVTLQAVERAPGNSASPNNASSAIATSSQGSERPQLIELFSHKLILWDVDKEASSSNASTATVPSTMPFSFPLTSDLPHCIHLRQSSLAYSITAQLFSEDAGKLPHAVKTVPVHLVRYTRPGPLNEVELNQLDGAAATEQKYTLQPHNWVEQAPTLVYAQINRTIFRRAEPIDIRVRIPPPDPTNVTEKGLKLRAVEADLIRIIHVKRPSGQETDDGARAKTVLTDRAAVQELGTDPDVHQALLAHSGKLCRFHSQRPVLLRLTLHPPFDRANMPHPHPDHDALVSGPVFGRGGGGGCESISQETLMHKISFEVRIKIGILGGRGERRDILLRRAVRILPGAAGALENQNDSSLGGFSTLSEKERLKRSEKARMLADDQQPGESSSRSPEYASGLLDFGMEDEYDGYEDVGRSLNDLMEAADQSNVAGSSNQAMDHAERLEQLRQFLEVSDPSTHHDGPPPSLLESRNDLQVEVEVDGVGLAMPRHPLRHPADQYPEMDSTADDTFPPPPPIDGTHANTEDTLSPYAEASLASESAAMVLSDRTDSQPSLQHAVDQSQRTTKPGPNAGADCEAHPSYEAVMSGSQTPLSSHPESVSHHEPPPYIDGSSHADPAPPFDQAVRQHASSGGLSIDHGAASNDQIEDRQDLSQVQRSLSVQHASAQSEDHRPPAYGTSPHPPSYDA
ncbi:hypothetical protein PHSY_004953 [Pseudozyma hubeiensis SY62]|uniref:Uncharacterized protein n=1 Tax=Pseudozyma hubeiensis (strain SY62) TaxID=1305764 RepID=R9P7K8_PSEHS|nr:hypothetical protein PHSY_004953 [Pseudozyma hubeiensis SY62]GAC97368.1 hypothetical protein PHSY_004953 [Pseudozyma hubeiensis SY62]